MIATSACHATFEVQKTLHVTQSVLKFQVVAVRHAEQSLSFEPQQLRW